MVSKMAKSDQAFDVNAVPEPLEQTTVGGGQQDFGTDHYAAGGFSDDDDYDGGDGVGSMGEASVFMADGQEAHLVGSSG